MQRTINARVVYRLIGCLVLLLVGTLSVPAVTNANSWYIGSDVGLAQGTHIYQGNGYNYSCETIVPEPNWLVRVIGGPRYTNGQTWWDISRAAVGDPSGGTGWVEQNEADGGGTTNYPSDCGTWSGGGNPTPTPGGGGGGGGPSPTPTATPTPAASTRTDFSQLRVGDIIVKRGHLRYDDGLALLIGGYWSHAAIVTEILNGVPYIAEAYAGTIPYPLPGWTDHPGVVNHSIYTSGVWTDAVDTAILRVTSGNPAAAGPAAAGLEGHLYNWAIWNKYVTDKYYCSQLVWKVYNDQGIDLDSNQSVNGLVLRGDLLPGLGPLYTLLSFLDINAVLPDDLYFSPHVQLVSQHTLSTGESLKRTVIWIFSPANLYLVGPDGQAVGTDPVTGQQHLDIDGASYTGPDTEPKVLAVPNLAGTWQLHVTGTATGTYDLLFEGIDNIHPRVLMTGTTAPGVDAIYTINRDAAGGLAAAPQDQTPPTTQLSIQGTLAPSGWYTTPVALVLNAVDGLPGTAVGVARTEYSLDNGSTWQIYQAPVTLTDGTYTMLYRSVDYVNNVEPAQSVHLQIDTVPPVVNLSTDQSQYTRLAAPVVHASAFDPAPGSGLASFQVLFGNQIVIDGQTLDLFWLPLGTYTLTGTAQDRAGWITARSSSFTLIATLDSLRATILRLHQLGEIDNDGVTNSFLAKVDAATYAASREQGTAARNQLDALIHELAAQNGHHITAGAATLLTEDVRYVRVHLR